MKFEITLFLTNSIAPLVASILHNIFIYIYIICRNNTRIELLLKAEEKNACNLSML